jgi:hypothetical protein
MKKLTCNLLLVSSLLVAASTQAKIIVVNNSDNANFDPGVTNLVTAIRSLEDGDTINFGITNASADGVHYLLTPVNGYPLITNQSVTFDGYSQPGAVPNSNPIHATNNAQLKIVLSSTNGNGIAIRLAAQALVGRVFERPGFNDNDNAILAFFRGTNNWIKGFAFQGAATAAYNSIPGPLYGLAFMADDPGTQPWPNANAGHWHISGCYSGLDPVTKQPVYLPNGELAAPEYVVGMQRHRNGGTVTNVNYAQPGTIGVAKASSDPRAEFNVFLGVTAANLTGLNYRICGNFFNVLPDGMTNFDVAYLPNATTLMGTDQGVIIIARQGDNVLVGTDGDGVNDDQEGNVFGGASAYPNSPPANVANYHYFDAFYNPAPSTPKQGTNNIFAGNYFGVAVDGVTRFTNCMSLFVSFPSTGDVRFGSDFDGVSDALEANLLYNNYPFDTHFPPPNAGTTPETIFDGTGASENFGGMNPGLRMAFRGNVTVGNDLLPYKYANGAGTLLPLFTNYSAPYMSTAASIIPRLSASSTSGDIIGTCALPNGAYTNLFIDVYVLDPESWANGALFEEVDLNPVVFTNGFPQGKGYLGTFVDNGPLDRDPAVGGFNFKAATLGLVPGTKVTATANYSADPVGTHNGRTHTSNFSDPATLREPLKITSVARNGSNVTISWTGGTAPFSLQSRSLLTGAWTTVQTGIATSSTTYSESGGEAFYQVLGN